MWAEIWECVTLVLKLFCFLGVVGFLYYLVLVGMGLENIATMITSSVGLLFLYFIIFGELEIKETLFSFWNPACLMLSPAMAVVTVVLIWFGQD